MMAALRRTLKSTRSSRKSAKKTRKMKRGTRRPKKSGSKRKLNPYMRAVKKARKSNASSFKYKGKTYTKKRLKTGMVVFKG